MGRIKIGLLHRADVADVHKLSGTPYYMAEALEKHVGDIHFIRPKYSKISRALEFVGLAASRMSRLVTHHRLPHDHNRLLSSVLAHSFKAQIDAAKCDVIFAPMASAEIALLQTNTPIVYCTDATWDGIADYYPGATSLFNWGNREADRIERLAIGRASASTFPSQWAADSAIFHYGISSEKVFRVPFGPNFALEDIPTRKLALEHRTDGPISLLWIGVNWERKGGTIAYDCLLSLLRKGVDARLIICGCVPPANFKHEHVDVIPFLSKEDPLQRARLSSLLLNATFLIFPTQAEALGIVVCEASAHGLPVLARNTGGVGGALRDGVNGVLMPPDALGEDYAARLLRVFRDGSNYSDLVRQSRDLFETTLNWDAWGASMKHIFNRIVQ